jgi:isopentenyl diphosphate isomerase/L-lactate dehydrogenase-like FMN-dependent dehydrogenase
MADNFFSVADARAAAKRRMPTSIFDFVDGAAGSEYACEQNRDSLDRIRLQPRVLVNIENRNLRKKFLGREWNLPFGIAPMGMCDLVWPGADKMLAAAAVEYNIPLAVSTMASTNIEDTHSQAGGNAWFQLYVGQSEELAFDLVQRAERAAYDTLILTVDVPLAASRPREQRSGFQANIHFGPKQIVDFAMHPRWSILTLLTGVPVVANNVGSTSGKKVARDKNRGKIDRDFLDRLRDRWRGKLIVKGVISPDDARFIRAAGADAIYVSNHGGRQLDSAPASIQMLPVIRDAVGPEYPLVFDSGVRNGEAVVKALALGANFVMLGRPFLYGIGGAGRAGLKSVIDVLTGQVETTLAQLGRPNIDDIDRSVIVDDTAPGSREKI